MSAAVVNAPVTELGWLLRAIRQDRGLSLRTVAQAVPVSPSYLSQCERGLSMPSPSLRRRLAHFYGTTMAA